MRKVLKGFLGVAALAGLGIGVWASVRAWQGLGPRVLVLGPSVTGLPSSEALGVQRLLQDELELKLQAPIVPVVDAVVPSGLDASDLVVRFSGEHAGDRLSLKVEWIKVRDLRAGNSWQSASCPPLAPSLAVQRVWDGGPWPVMKHEVPDFLPATTQDFWELARLSSIQEDVAATADLEDALRLSEREPRSAVVWANLGEFYYRDLWTRPAGGDMPQNQAAQALGQALALVPNYPRAALLMGMLDTDIGDQRSGLRILVAARKAHPGVPNLYSGLAYAGRTAGLLEGAQRALMIRRDLVGPIPVPEGWFVENTYLYCQRWKEFRECLTPRPDPIIQFYQGYLDLIEGNRDAALVPFTQGAADRRTSLPFSDLCGIYALALQGRQDEALSKLRAFDEARGHLRVPDGELTFKVAEAYAFLGQNEDALTAAGRAFAQGFGCLAWYDGSPLLAPVRMGLRWSAFRQHIVDRQALLEQSYPPSTFG